MNFAYDVVLKRDIDAESDDVRRGQRGRYICPVCRSRVYHARGIYQCSHFRHNPNEGRLDCELYHPGLMAQVMAPVPFFKEDEALQRLRIGLELDVSGVRGEWILMLRIPGFSNGHPKSSRHDIAYVCRGAERLVDLPLQRLENGPVTYDAVPTDDALGIRSFSDGVSLSIRQRFAPMSILLPTDRCAVFHATGLTFMRGVGAQLYWNTRYYLLWTDKLPVTIPRSLLTKQLSQVNGWQCALITLPDKPNEADRLWILQHTGYDVASRSVDVTIIAPSLVAENHAIYTINWEGEVLVSVRRKNDEALHDRVTIETIDGNYAVPADGSRLLNIAVARKGRDESLYLRYGNEPGVLITAGDPSIATEPCGVFLSTTNASGEEATAPFESIEAHQLLSLARRKLQGVRIWERGHFTGTVRYRGPDEVTWSSGATQEQFSNHRDAGNIEVPLLSHYLNEASSEILIRIGPAISQRVSPRFQKQLPPTARESPFIKTQERSARATVIERYDKRSSINSRSASDILECNRRYASALVDRANCNG